VDSEHYIARYIIKKQESFSRIRFVRADAFGNILPEYTHLHASNCHWFDTECKDFYADVLKDHKRVRLLIEDFRDESNWPISYAFMRNNIEPPELKTMFVSWSATGALAQISGAFGSDGSTILNNDSEAKAGVAEALQKVYRYNGPFVFEDDDIPF